jgi:hypothetical protein
MRRARRSPTVVARNLLQRRAKTRALVVLRAVGKLAAQAVTAVDGARARGNEQRPAAALVQQARCAYRATLCQRIRPVARRAGGEFRGEGQYLAQQRVVQIATAGGGRGMPL